MTDVVKKPSRLVSPDTVRAHTGRRLLVVENRNNVYEHVVERLERRGLATDCRRVADNGALFEALATSGWDLLLADTGVPGIKPADVIDASRRSDDTVPVVALCERAGKASLQSLYDAGFDDIVTTDDLDRLVPVIERCLGDARQRRECRRLEAELRLANRRYRATVENSQDLICRYDTRGRLRFVNQAFCEFFDRPREALIGSHLRELAPPGDQLSIRRQLAMLASSGGSSVNVHRVIDRDRRTRWIRWLNHVTQENGGIVAEIQAVGQDITAQKEAELAVAESEQRFRIAAECATDLIYERDFEGRVLNWFGTRSRRGDMGMVLPPTYDDWLDMIDSEDRQQVREALRDHLKSGIPYELEYRVTDDRGQRRYLVDRGSVTFDEQGDAAKWVGAIDDITESRLAEQSLRENQSRLNHRLSLERVISELSSRLHAGENEDDVAEATAPALGRIGALIGAERGYIVRLADDGTCFRRELEWCKDGASSHGDLLEDFDIDIWHDVFDAYAAGEVVHANDPESVGARFDVLRRFMIGHGIVSIVTVPVFHDQRLGGVLGFETLSRRADWLAEDVRLLQTTAEIIGRAIGNARNRRRLLETNRKLECLDRLSRALTGRSGLNAVIEAVTAASRELFAAECAWMVFPCDPQSRNIRIRKEAVAPGARRDDAHQRALAERLPAMMRRALAADRPGPVICPLPERRCTVMYGVLRARVGKPWLFGIEFMRGHDPDESERDLFASLAERTVDALSEALLLDELRKNEMRLDEAQSVAHVGSLEIDWSEDRLWCSREVFSILGIDAQVFDGRIQTLFRAVHDEDAGRVREAFDRSLAEHAPYDDAFRLRLASGAIKHVNLRCVTRHDDGTPVRTIGTIQDVTAGKMIEDALRQTHKLEAVGQLTGGIAHDFNNLLSIILGNLDLVLRDAETDERFAQRVGAARRAAQRGADLTRKLLSASRKSETRPRMVDVNRVLTDMEELISRSLTPTVHVQTRLDPDLGSAIVDPGALQDALLNLVINARDAMPAGGELLVETRNVLRPEPTSADGGAAGEDAPGRPFISIRIADSGTGMSPDVLEHALEPFFTTKEPGKGTGLGLAMVYAFVTQSGGMMEIDSSPDKGTAVVLNLPAAAASHSEDPVPRRTAELVGGNETILVVDDEAELVELAEEFLRELGYRTLSARNGRDALALLSSNPEIDLLFSDILMPGGMNGYELAESAAGSKPGLKVLLCSGYAERVNAAAGDPAETTVLRKPYQVDELSRAVRRILDAD